MSFFDVIDHPKMLTFHCNNFKVLKQNCLWEPSQDCREPGKLLAHLHWLVTIKDVCIVMVNHEVGPDKSNLVFESLENGCTLWYVLVVDKLSSLISDDIGHDRPVQGSSFTSSQPSTKASKT